MVENEKQTVRFFSFPADTAFFFLVLSLDPSLGRKKTLPSNTATKTAEPDVKTLETMRKFSEQFAKR